MIGQVCSARLNGNYSCGCLPDDLVCLNGFFLLFFEWVNINKWAIKYIDVNECELDTHNCSTQATCTNTIGSFNCTCNIGYSRNGTSCVGRILFYLFDNWSKEIKWSELKLDENECELNTDNCSTDAICINIPGSFNCTCNTGYSGNGTSCEGKISVWTFDCSFFFQKKKKWS